MWTREELKSRAKIVLSKSYGSAFLVSLLMALTGYRGGSRLNWQRFEGDSSELIQILPFMLMAGLLFFMIGLSVRVFLGYPLEVGGRKFYIHAAQGEVTINVLSHGFNKSTYFNLISVMLWRELLVFLWTLLLIIPGIVKSYAYRMVPYILADNPQINFKRAVELSDKMTFGHKSEIFVLDLSFIGWYILGLFACCIGVIFIFPYQDATDAELYLVLRQEAIQKGLCTDQELNLSQRD